MYSYRDLSLHMCLCATRALCVLVCCVLQRSTHPRLCVVLAPWSMDGCDAWLSASSQLSGAGSLLVDCGRTARPPCVSPGFFHALRDRERERLTMPHPWMWNHAPTCSRADLYTQCRQRRRDKAWPEDPHELRTPATKTVVDLLPLLGDRVVTVVGSSVELQLELAIQCALAGASRCSGSGSWRHWGWGTFHDDNAGCTRQKTPKEILDSGCAASGVAFEEMLAHTDIVIVGYNPQFAFRHSEELWANNLRAMLPMLERFARRPGKGKSAPPLEAPGPRQSHTRISDLSLWALWRQSPSYGSPRRSTSLEADRIMRVAIAAPLSTRRAYAKPLPTPRSTQTVWRPSRCIRSPRSSRRAWECCRYTTQRGGGTACTRRPCALTAHQTSSQRDDRASPAPTQAVATRHRRHRPAPHRGGHAATARTFVTPLPFTTRPSSRRCTVSSLLAALE